MKSRWMSLALMLALAGAPRALADGPTSASEEQVAAAVVWMRHHAGATPLVRDPDLDEVALLQVTDMAAHAYVGHESERTGNPSTRAARVGVPLRRVGENVARGRTLSEVLAGIAESEPHRAQVLAAEYTHFGVAVAERDGFVYVCEVFGARAAATMPPPDARDVTPASPSAPVAPSAPIAPIAPVEAAPPTAPSVPAAPPSDPGVAPAPIAPDPTLVPDPGRAGAYGGAESYVTPAPPQAQAAAVAPSQPGVPPTVVLQMVPPPNVQGYWVQYQGQWWYFPVAPNTRPGTVLQPTTPPPGAVPPAGQAPMPVVDRTGVAQAPARPMPPPPPPPPRVVRRRLFPGVFRY